MELDCANGNLALVINTPGFFLLVTASDFLLYFVEQVVKNSGPPIFGLDLSRLIVPFGELWPVTSSGYMNEIS